MAVDMFAKDGVRFVGISGKDINDNNEKLILGLVWSLITHYSIGKTVSTDDSKINVSTGNKCNNSKDYKNVLLSWANDRIDSYFNIQKFTPYGLSMCALLDSYVPDKINFYSLDPNNTKANTELATHVMKELGIPVYVYPEDILRNNAVDEKTLLIQLSSAKEVLENLPQEQLLENSEERKERLDAMEESSAEDIPPQEENSEERKERLDAMEESSSEDVAPREENSEERKERLDALDKSSSEEIVENHDSEKLSKEYQESVLQAQNERELREEAEAKANQLAMELEKAKAEIQSQKENLETVNREADLLANTLNEKLQENPAHKNDDQDNEKEALNREADLFANTLNDKMNENESLNREADLFANTLNDKINENDALNREADLFANTLNDKMNENESLNREADLFANALNDKMKENESLNREADLFANALNDKIKENEELKRDNEDLNNAAEIYYNSITNKAAENAGLNQQVEIFADTLADKITENATLNREANLLANTLNDKIKENEELKKDNEELNETANLYLNELTNKISENASLQKQVDIFADTLAEKLNENASLSREANILANALSEKINESKSQEDGFMQIAGQKFALTMSLKRSEYKHCHHDFEKVKTYAVTIVDDDENHPFLNEKGMKIKLAPSKIETNANQQFVFGKDNCTIISSVKKQGMVFDFADKYNLTNPPEMTPVFLSPFQGQRNQHFAYKNGMICAQNGLVVTYVGGDVPFVLMNPRESFKSRQTFHLTLL